MTLPFRIVHIRTIAERDEQMRVLLAEVVKLRTLIDRERKELLDNIVAALKADYSEFAGAQGTGPKIRGGKALASVQNRARLEGYLAALNNSASIAAKVIWPVPAQADNADNTGSTGGEEGNR